MILPTIRASFGRRDALHLVDVARNFCGARRSLNQLSDRYLWPAAGDPVSRLIREATSRGGER